MEYVSGLLHREHVGFRRPGDGHVLLLHLEMNSDKRKYRKVTVLMSTLPGILGLSVLKCSDQNQENLPTPFCLCTDCSADHTVFGSGVQGYLWLSCLHGLLQPGMALCLS